METKYSIFIIMLFLIVNCTSPNFDNKEIVENTEAKQSNSVASARTLGHITDRVTFKDYNGVTSKVVVSDSKEVTEQDGVGYLVFTKQDMLNLFNEVKDNTPNSNLYGELKGIRFGTHLNTQKYAFCYVKSARKSEINKYDLNIFGIVKVNEDGSTIENIDSVGFVNYNLLPCPPYCSTWSKSRIETSIQKSQDLLTYINNLDVKDSISLK
jgi:hypothetical protein